MTALATLLSRALRHLLPGACLLCDQVLAGHEALDLCPYCASALPWNPRACPRCALPLAPGESVSAPCGDCQQQPPPFTHAVAPLRYDGCAQVWVSRLKDRLGLVEGRVLGTLMAQAAAAAYRGDDASPPPRRPDLLVPVPLTPWRLALRGHNQALTLALPVARRLDVPVLRRAVVRASGGGHQRGRSRAQRLRSSDDIFFASRLEWRTAPCIAVVDDVITTGTTAAALTRCLLSAGAGEVHVIAAARTPRRQRATGATHPAVD
jgi:predicted amidophosphoribosyltransferase